MDVCSARIHTSFGRLSLFDWNHATSFCSPSMPRAWPKINCSLQRTDKVDEVKFEDVTMHTKQRWKWALIMSYDGTRYSGWQVQPKATTVQQTIETILCKITSCTQDELSVTAASRTDAGVHAWGQTVSFLTPFTIKKLDTLHCSLNSMLPHDIRIRGVHAVQQDFHVRYHPISKTYEYKAYVAPIMDPFQRLYAYHFPYAINVVAMQEAASLFIGEHNFSAFANASPKALLSPVRQISKLTVLSSGRSLSIKVQGKAFLYKQVRNMVGLLLEIGRGTLPSSAVTQILASRDRKKLALVASTAPAHGLYLMSVNYEETLFLDQPKASCVCRDDIHLISCHHECCL